MATFTDKHGRKWDLLIEVPHLKPLREQFQFEPVKAFTESVMVELLTDPERLVGILYTLCEAQATTAKVSPEDFGRSFGGPEFDAAFKALIESVSDFSPLSRAAKRAGAGLQSHFDRIETRAMNQVDAALRGLASNDSAANSPGASASSPAPSP